MTGPDRPSVPPAEAGAPLARRLLLALLLVLGTTGVTAAVVAGAVGPAIFHAHLVETHVGTAEQALVHAEMAFRTAGGLALGIGLGIAAVAALLLSLLMTRRVAGSLDRLTGALHAVADGDLAAHVPPSGLSAEFDDLAGAVNGLTARLRASEALRRRLLADVAHELRTPVTTLAVHLEGLEDGVTRLDQDTIDVLRAQGSRLTRLAEDLAAVTRAESGEARPVLGPCRVEDVVRSAVGTLRPRAEHAGVALRTSFEDPLPVIVADTERLGQVLVNLLDNAVRHTPSGGGVTVEVGTAGPEDTQATHATHVVVTVRDTGAGIAAQHLPHVFERFYRADDARDRDHGGSGVGLAIVRAWVEAHGGTVTAASDGEGEGAVFEVRLPVAGPAARRGGADRAQ